MKFYYSKLLFALLIFLVGFNGFTQSEIKGKVADFMTYAPIESASVYIDKTTIGTITNVDGKFALRVPQANLSDTLVISSKSFKITIADFENGSDIFLEEDVASLEEVLLIADTRPKTGNDIMIRALERLPDNMPNQPFLQKGFLRHKERNKKEYKWLIEAAITLYDSEYAAGAKDNLKLNVDENKKEQ